MTPALTVERSPARRMITGSAAATTTGFSAGSAHAAVPTSPGVTYPITIAEQRTDPHIYKHTDGFHYFTAQGLTSAPETTIWTKRAGGDVRPHLGSGDPRHRRQVVRLLRRR